MPRAATTSRSPFGFSGLTRRQTVSSPPASAATGTQSGWRPLRSDGRTRGSCPAPGGPRRARRVRRRRDARGVSNVLRVDDARGEVRVGVRVGIRASAAPEEAADGRGSNAGSRGRPATRDRAGTPRDGARERGTRARRERDACAETRDMSVRAIEGARTEVRGWTGRRRAWKPIRNASRAAHEKRHVQDVCDTMLRHTPGRRPQGAFTCAHLSRHGSQRSRKGAELAGTSVPSRWRRPARDGRA